MDPKMQEEKWTRRTADFILGFMLGIIVGGNLIIVWIAIGGLND
jgi:hypothetical protein